MATVETGLQSQIRNIESTYGRSMAAWTALIADRGLTRHGQIVAMLKAEHGMAHGAANRTALVAMATLNPAPADVDPVEALLAGRPPAVREVFERLLAVVRSFGSDIELAPKKGYVSLRRRTQFGMLQPAADRVNVGLVLPAAPLGDRLESARTFNALFSHRVRVRSVDEIDGELVAWLHRAYDRAG